MRVGTIVNSNSFLPLITLTVHFFLQMGSPLSYKNYSENPSVSLSLFTIIDQVGDAGGVSKFYSHIPVLTGTAKII